MRAPSTFSANDWPFKEFTKSSNKHEAVIHNGHHDASIANLSAQDLNTLLNNADAFFQKNVNNGLIDYRGIQSDPSDLNALVKQVAELDGSNLSAQERKAFYINAYNISVINGIIAHYPTNSPLDIGGFFDMKKHNISGEKITLNKLEKEYLLKTTGDEKLHFVLVCAAISCPAIADYAYRPEQLDAQILDRTQKALSNPDFIRVDNAKEMVGLSESLGGTRAISKTKQQTSSPTSINIAMRLSLQTLKPITILITGL